MSYDEFTSLLWDMNVPRNEWPSVEVYHDIIEHVYNYHPAFVGASRYAKCAKLYAVGGIGVFYSMMEDADEAKEMEENINALREKCDRIRREYDEACERFTAYRQSMMQMWRVE